MHEYYHKQLEGCMTEWKVRNCETNEISTIIIPKLDVMRTHWGVPSYISVVLAADYAKRLPSINFRFGISFLREL